MHHAKLPDSGVFHTHLKSTNNALSIRVKTIPQISPLRHFIALLLLILISPLKSFALTSGQPSHKLIQIDTTQNPMSTGSLDFFQQPTSNWQRSNIELFTPVEPQPHAEPEEQPQQERQKRENTTIVVNKTHRIIDEHYTLLFVLFFIFVFGFVIGLGPDSSEENSRDDQ